MGFKVKVVCASSLCVVSACLCVVYLCMCIAVSGYFKCLISVAKNSLL